MTGAPTALDMQIGRGDGTTSRFALIKSYGGLASGEVRRITRPVAASLMIAIDGARSGSGWTLEAGGWIAFATPPRAGASISAGFLFDVPVRFETDQLHISAHGFGAGELASVPLIEVREV